MSAIVEAICSSQETLSVCLWQENPNRLVSLLEIMKAFHAKDMLFAARELQNRAGLVFDSKRGPAYKLAAIDGFRESLEAFTKLCTELDLPMSSLHASQLLESTDSPARGQLDATAAERIATMLLVTVENELSLRQFFAISQDKSKFYNDSAQPFGDTVANSFPSVSFDAGEANRCYALGRNTACVFHLMRVLEIGLQVFAARFGVPADHTNWHNIIEGIEKAVRNMGSDPTKPADWKDQQEFFAQAANSFMFIKEAWRNYTAHARGKYTDEEGATALINVRAFMQKLAMRLHE